MFIANNKFLHFYISISHLHPTWWQWTRRCVVPSCLLGLKLNICQWYRVKYSSYFFLNSSNSYVFIFCKGICILYEVCHILESLWVESNEFCFSFVGWFFLITEIHWKVLHFILSRGPFLCYLLIKMWIFAFWQYV